MLDLRHSKRCRRQSDSLLTVADSMTASIVKKLMNSEEPENAAKYLLENGASLSHAQALKAAIGPQGQNVVSGGVLKELLNQSTNEANQTLNPSTLMAKWNDLGPAAQQALFPNQEALSRCNSNVSQRSRCLCASYCRDARCCSAIKDLDSIQYWYGWSVISECDERSRRLCDTCSRNRPHGSLLRPDVT